VSLPPHPLERVERLEQLRPLAHGLAIGVALLTAPVEGGIDTEDDLARAQARFADAHVTAAATASSALPFPPLSSPQSTAS